MAFSTGLESIDFIANDCNINLDQPLSGGLPGVEESENIHVPTVGCFFRSVEAPGFIRGLTPEERKRREKTLLRKIDLRLLPAIVLMYILNYLDRNNIAVARLAGLERDLRLTSVQYNTSLSILFVGYILMQIPSNLFLNKIGKPALYLPTCMIIWGCISGATGGTQTYGGLIACRFPGCLFYLSSWYTRNELGLRTAVLYSGSLISGAFSGLVGAGITGNMDGAKGLSAWRWLFIIEGSISVVVAFFAYFTLPNFLRTTTWLTEEESELAVWRLIKDIGEDDWVDSKHQSSANGFKLAFTDPKTYIFMAILFCIVSSGSVTNFFPTVVETLGYNRFISLLLTAPPYVLAIFAAFLNAWHADRTGERYFHIVLPLCFGVAAFILAATTTATAPRYLAMMLMVPGVFTGYIVVFAWISNTIPRPPAKRAAALAGINAVSNAALVYTPYMYPSSAGPHYVVAMSINCTTAIIAILVATFLRTVLIKLNKQLDSEEMVTTAKSQSSDVAQPLFRFRI